MPCGDVPARAMSPAEPPSDFPVLLRLGPGGGILRNEGGDEELAAVVANARRLGRLAGQLLGMDLFVAMECIPAKDLSQLLTAIPRDKIRPLIAQLAVGGCCG